MMADNTIENNSTPSPSSYSSQQFQAANRRVQKAKTDQQQAIQNKRQAQVQEQRAQERLAQARAEEVQAGQRMREAQSETQDLARKRIDVIV